MREPTVMLTHSIRSWNRELHFFLMDHGGALLRGFAAGAEDVLRDQYDVLVVDDVTSYLSHRLVATLRSRGSAVLGVFAPEDPGDTGKQRLEELGVDDTIASDASPEEFLEAILRIAGPGAAPTGAGGGNEGRPQKSRRGLILTVIAASGGSGATEVALGVAVEASKRDIHTVLVDADEQSPSVGQRIGLPLQPNIRNAIDAVQHNQGELADAVHSVPELGIEVLPGLPNPRNWSELRAEELIAVVHELAGLHDLVVINGGSRIEDLAALGGPQRFGVSRAVTQTADVVALVTVGSPVGAGRALDWAADAGALLEGTARHLVINRFEGGGFTWSELHRELSGSLDLNSITAVPHDPKVWKAAWQGTQVGHGPFTRAMSRLVDRAV